jgi:predicted membrane-bound spermidine synthase
MLVTRLLVVGLALLASSVVALWSARQTVGRKSRLRSAGDVLAAIMITDRWKTGIVIYRRIAHSQHFKAVNSGDLP